MVCHQRRGPAQSETRFRTRLRRRLVSGVQCPHNLAKKGIMNRERALKVVLVLVGLLFSAGIYPLVTTVRSELQPNIENALPMMLSLYVTLGVFLLVAARNPSANSS